MPLGPDRRNGIEVEHDRIPVLGFGTWQLTGRSCYETVLDALEIGYRHIDTAEAYGNEEEVGRAIGRSNIAREEIFVTTKIAWHRLAPETALRSAEGSLARLGLDYVDLLLIHWPSPDVPLEDTLAALRILKEEGKTRHIGVSNFSPSLWRAALKLAPVVCNQVEFHPLLSQNELLGIAQQRKLVVTAYSPLARGRVNRDPLMKDLARRYRKTPAQVALRWLIQQERVCAIPKAAGREHRRENFAIFDFELSAEDASRIAGLTRLAHA